MKTNRCLICSATWGNCYCHIGRVVAALLLLAAWCGTLDPASASIATRLTAPAGDSEDIAARVQTEYGAGSAVADWNALKDQFADNLAAFYAQTGLAPMGGAFVTHQGERFMLDGYGRSHYYVQRWNGVPSSGYWLDGFGFLYLGRWHDITMPPVARVTLRCSDPMLDSADIPALLESANGPGVVMVDWDEIKAKGSSQLPGFYAHTGLLDGQSAFVTRSGQRTVLFNGAYRHYYVTRFDAGPPLGSTCLDSIGTLYLQRWNNVTFSAVCKMAVPPAPMSVSASENQWDRVVVTWPAAPHAQTYNVWRSDTNVPATASLIGADVVGLNFTDYPDVVGRTYYYWVKARNTAGVSALSGGDPGSRNLIVSLGPPPQWLDRRAQLYQINVSANGPWTATDNQGWISLSPSSGNGNATLTVTVTTNDASILTRTGTITVGGQTHVLNQEGLVWPSPAAFRLTAAVPDSTDIVALVDSTFGGGAVVADWNDLVLRAAPDLASFYTQTGLGDQSSALVTLGGERYLLDTWGQPRHYYVKHSETVPPREEEVLASARTLYLERWSPVVMPVAARMRYQLSPAITDATDPVDWVHRSFGLGVEVAEWNTIKAAFAANPNAFYAHTGLRDRGMAWVKCGGSLVHPVMGWRYFVQRADNGTPDFPSPLDQSGSLCLAIFSINALPVIADMSGWSSKGFVSWMGLHYNVPVLQRGLLDDPDGDGSPNLAEYAAATNPGDPSSRPGIYSPSQAGSSYTFLFSENPSTFHVSQQIQWSPDLVRWAASGEFVGAVKVSTKYKLIDDQLDHQILEAHASVVQGGPLARIFFRCAATSTD